MGQWWDLCRGNLGFSEVEDLEFFAGFWCFALECNVVNGRDWVLGEIRLSSYELAVFYVVLKWD